MRYATICAIVKDEDASLREWLSYHLAIGFEHAVIYDNGSAMPASSLLREFAAAGLVTVIDFPLRENQQLSAYFHCLREQWPLTRWLAFIDVDEFVVPLQHADIKEFLDDYRDYGGVGIHWKMFGSNGHLRRPQGRTIENYTESTGLNQHIKSIVQAEFATHPLSPHHFAYKDNYYCVNEDKFIIDSPFSYPIADKIALNHYYYKSQQDYEEKINRGVATKMRNIGKRSLTTFYEHLNCPVSKDVSILKFVEMLDLYDKLPPLQIAGIIANESSLAVSGELAKIKQSLADKNLREASLMLKKLKRYHNNFEIMLLDALLLVLNGNKDAGMKALSSLFLNNKTSPEKIYDIYRQLTQIYIHSCNVNGLASLDNFLKSHSSS